MDDLLRELMGAREGHFLLESGHHGPLWLDLESLFLRPARIAPLVDALAQRLAPLDCDMVCGPMVGGALLAQQVAAQLEILFVHSQRTSHRPGTMRSAVYEMPPALRPSTRGARVIVVDDVVNAGSAARSTIAAVRAAGGHPAGLASLVCLGDGAADLASDEGVELFSLAAWPGTLWEPSACPRCSDGVPLQDPGA